MYVSALHSVRCRLPAWNPSTAKASALLTKHHSRKYVARLIASSACTPRVSGGGFCGSGGVEVAITRSCSRYHESDVARHAGHHAINVLTSGHVAGSCTLRQGSAACSRRLRQQRQQSHVA